ncbi:MAG: hypothetical protein ACTH8F_08400 [Microbacterium sp.]
MSASITIDPRGSDAPRVLAETLGGRVIDLSSTAHVELDSLKPSAQ